MFLYPFLRESLITLNPGVVGLDNVDEIIGRIESVRYGIEGNAETLAWLRGQKTVEVPKENRERNVTVIDFDHPANNKFHVTDEWEYTNGQKRNKADVMFLINGIPVAIVETKSARKADGVSEGLKQIRRYHEETPEMMTAPQVFDVTHLIEFYYGATWSLDRKNVFRWKEDDRDNFERKVKRFFARELFLKLLQSWILFYKKDDELRKTVLRQHQTRAVEKVLERAMDPVKKTGLIWHTQGSGKTFTMITAAQHILSNPAFEKPTVIMLVDRNELEGQLAGWIASLLGEGKAVLATSKQSLRDLLRSDYRGLVVSMIHKFDKADADLTERKNVFVLIDEAHRSTSGDLGNYLLAALPNATYVGFTGTPIDKIAYGKGTFKVFGKDDPKGYLDKYSIAESIEDGTTLKLNYTLAPNDIRVPEDILEKEFLSLTETEAISDIEELNRLLERAVNLKAFLKSKDRVEKVAAFVAKHFRDNVEPLGYKAFLVGVDREACALYKKELDKHLRPEESVVVYTSAHNDDKLLAEYKISEDEEKRVRKAFIKKDKLPKILIVTEKLLTGFDAPILYCMYLDKPMRDHTLLQAIARVNRPYEDEGRKKPAGFVLDFVGIFDKLERALAFDSDEVKSVVQNLETLKETFRRLMEGLGKEYLALCGGRISDKAVEKAAEAFADKGKRELFFAFFKETEALYEIISPDVFLRSYLERYRQLVVLYQVVRNYFSPRPVLMDDLMKKTEMIVRESVEAFGFGKTMPVVEINEHTLKALKEGQDDGPGKVVNLVKTLVSAVQSVGKDRPHLVSIGERAEKILELYDDRQVTTQDAIRELEGLMEEYSSAKKSFENLGYSPQKFSVYWALTQAGLSFSPKVLDEAEGAMNKHPDYLHNIEEERALKAELYGMLLSVTGKERLKEITEKLMAWHGK